MIMNKRIYIQPEMKTETFVSDAPVMQLVLGSPTAPEPHKPAPKKGPEVF